MRHAADRRRGTGRAEAVGTLADGAHAAVGLRLSDLVPVPTAQWQSRLTPEVDDHRGDLVATHCVAAARMEPTRGPTKGRQSRAIPSREPLRGCPPVPARPL